MAAQRLNVLNRTKMFNDMNAAAESESEEEWTNPDYHNQRIAYSLPTEYRKMAVVNTADVSILKFLYVLGC